MALSRVDISVKSAILQTFNTKVTKQAVRVATKYAPAPCKFYHNPL